MEIVKEEVEIVTSIQQENMEVEDKTKSEQSREDKIDEKESEAKTLGMEVEEETS